MFNFACHFLCESVCVRHIHFIMHCNRNGIIIKVVIVLLLSWRMFHVKYSLTSHACRWYLFYVIFSCKDLSYHIITFSSDEIQWLWGYDLLLNLMDEWSDLQRFIVSFVSSILYIRIHDDLPLFLAVHSYRYQINIYANSSFTILWKITREYWHKFGPNVLCWAPMEYSWAQYIEFRAIGCWRNMNNLPHVVIMLSKVECSALWFN